MSYGNAFAILMLLVFSKDINAFGSFKDLFYFFKLYVWVCVHMVACALE